jgi:hypothetical protein
MEKKPDEKEPYEPPEIVKVKLVRDELAATHCKTSTSAGPTTGCLRGACRSIGS